MVNFDKYAQEGNLYLKELAEKLGHPDEKGRVSIIMRAVLHTLRERLTISESFNLMSQLPMFLKAIYVDNWKYREKPAKIKDINDFTAEVEKYQSQYGEQEFDWKKPTDEIVKIVFNSLYSYISKGEAEDVLAQFPEELEPLIKESMAM